MASPLSVGDCIAIAGVLIKGYSALSGSSDDARELRGLIVDLLYMKSILKQLPTSDPSLNSNPEIDFQKLEDAVRHCREVLLEITVLTQKYEPATSTVKTKYRRLAWTFWGKKEVGPYKLRIQAVTTMLSVAQAEVNRQAIENLKSDLQRQTNALSSQFELGKEEVKLKIYESIDEPWDHKPIKFQDATGRRFPIPLEVCQAFEDLCKFLKFSFKGTPEMLPFITRRDFWLFTPAKNGSPWWYLIHEKDWAQVAQSGVRLGMSLLQGGGSHSPRLSTYACVSRTPPRRSTSRVSDGSSVSARTREHLTVREGVPPVVGGHARFPLVSFSKPLPPWATLPEDLEFRWWSYPARFGPVSMTRPAGKEGSRMEMKANWKRKAILSCG